ncbi:hypothetical protein F4859DRAFT_509971 [Xylaria cf. heliscus]|nr:hypothetical protein F4859DRAFT_509971 [Xylaria cf. heliscus]
MSLTSAARRLLRTLSLTVMADLQRDGPAAGGRSWCAAAAAAAAAVVDSAGTDSSSTSSSSSSFELELWPIQSATISRRPPPSSFSCSSSIPPCANRQDNSHHLRNGHCRSAPGGWSDNPKDGARFYADHPSSPHQYILGNPKTIPPPPTSHIRLLPRTDSSDSIASNPSTFTSSTSCSSDSSEKIGNRRLARIPSIAPWNEHPATRRQPTRIDASATKQGDNPESEVFWRGYWD